MSAKLIEYVDASPRVRAVYDDTVRGAHGGRRVGE